MEDSGNWKPTYGYLRPVATNEEERLTRRAANTRVLNAEILLTLGKNVHFTAKMGKYKGNRRGKGTWDFSDKGE